MLVLLVPGLRPGRVMPFMRRWHWWQRMRALSGYTVRVALAGVWCWVSRTLPRSAPMAWALSHRSMPDEFGVPVGLVGPGPVGAGDLADFAFALALAGAGVAGAAEYDAAGVLGVFQDAGDGVGGSIRSRPGGALARSRRRAMVRYDSFSTTRHS